VCFRRKKILGTLAKSYVLCVPLCVIGHACIQKITKEVIKEGVDVMLQTAIKLLGRKKARTSGVILMIEDEIEGAEHR
jgi:hypothetical protein